MGILYEYECTKCGHNFEIEQSIKAKAKRKCPACSKNSLERLLFGGQAAFVRNEITTIGQLADWNFKKNKKQD